LKQINNLLNFLYSALIKIRFNWNFGSIFDVFLSFLQSNMLNYFSMTAIVLLFIISDNLLGIDKGVLLWLIIAIFIIIFMWFLKYDAMQVLHCFFLFILFYEINFHCFISSLWLFFSLLVISFFPFFSLKTRLIYLIVFTINSNIIWLFSLHLFEVHLTNISMFYDYNSLYGLFFFCLFNLFFNRGV
jgi:hypothetical protein